MSKMLSSWKEIAHFFGKGVRTVQRWEKTLDLPIHRPPGAPSNVVLARTSDLEAWMHRGPVSRLDEGTVSADPVSGLEALEQRVAQLAESAGVSATDFDASAGSSERVAALSDVVDRVNAKLSNGKDAYRAA